MDENSITKAQALEAYGGNASALARALKVTPQAIYQWDEGPIPDAHALRLRFVLRPGKLGVKTRNNKQKKTA